MDVERWVVLYIATISGEQADRIDTGSALSRYDIDSVDAVEMAMEFERSYGLDADPELFMRTDIGVAALVALLRLRLAER